MPAPGVVRGVVLAGRRPVAGARVYFRSGPGNLPDVAAMSGSDGTFALSAPRPGRYEVAASADGVGESAEEVEVSAGETVTVTLRLGSR